jgi:hypothetical protein
MKNVFNKEKDLIKTFIYHLENNQYDVDFVSWSFEFNFSGGRTDIIAKNTERKVYAFEAKLNNLKKVINQAYRNTSFADYSFVVLPESKKNAASRLAAEFKRRKIGLVFVNEEKAWTEINASHHFPLLPWLKDKADEALAGKRRYVNNGWEQVS